MSQGDDGGVEGLLGVTRRARAQCELSSIDYLRALQQLDGVLSQTEIARALRVSQPAVAKSLEQARELVALVPEGFSGATPYEIAQRFAVGEVDRATAVDELARWPYVPGPKSWAQAWDDQEVTPDGTFEEVGRAYNDGLLAGDMHDDILHRSVSAARPRRSR